MRRISVLFALALVGACSDLPRDPEGTTDKVRASGTIRLGMIEGAAPDPASEAVLERVAKKTGARIERVPGHAEKLLEDLEGGGLDLVYGHFADDSPWFGHVHLGKPPGTDVAPPKSQRWPRFAFRNGENGWIALLEGAAQ